MPGSQRRYAVDFDGDQVDLSGSVDDAIGSVARFLEQHGWQTGQPVAGHQWRTPCCGRHPPQPTKVAELADKGRGA